MISTQWEQAQLPGARAMHPVRLQQRGRGSRGTAWLDRLPALRPGEVINLPLLSAKCRILSVSVVDLNILPPKL